MTTPGGTWNLTIRSPIGDRKSRLALEYDGERLFGTMSGDDGDVPVHDATFSGGAVAWKTDITSPMPLTLEFSGEIEGDAMSGDVKLGMMGNAPFNGTRS